MIMARTLTPKIKRMKSNKSGNTLRQNYSTNRGYQDSLHGRFGLGERILAAAQERVGLLRQFAEQTALLSTVKLFSAANYAPQEKQILKWH
jgi:hypothetical protein